MISFRSVYFSFLLVFVQTILLGQNVGMQFYAHEKQLDQRTGLNLTPEKSFKIDNNFTLNFDIAFSRNQLTYFGYILRIIANDSINLDLVYDDVDFTINMIDGKSAKVVSAPVSIDELAQFKNISVNFNPAESKISLSIDDSVYTLITTSFNNAKKWKFLFGINHSKHFETTDLPGMQIRYINLFENGTKKHEWLLNKQAGNWIEDEMGKADAYVENPFWLYDLHSNWKLEKELSFSSYTQFVQKENSDTIFFLSADSLSTYGLQDAKIINRQELKRKINLPDGSQLIYNYLNNEIIYYSIDQKLFSKINISTLNPTNKIPENNNLTEFWQHNNFFYPADTSLITIGGYGRLIYKNTINSVNLNGGEWNSYSPEKSVVCPRYLSALGATENNDTLYLLGGYGSTTGKQKINPGYVYNLIRIIPETKKVEKVYSISDLDIDEFCLSNSLIINADSAMFYALAYSKYEYKNKLRLIRGSLNEPKITVDTKTIPFNFHDIMSYVDIIYSPVQRKIYAFTLFHNDNGITNVKIYSIYYLPEINVEKTVKEKSFFRTVSFLSGVSFVVFLVVLIFFLFVGKSKQAMTVVEKEEKMSDAETGLNTENSSTASVEHEETIAPDLEPECKYPILFFGGFHVIDSKSNNITNKFTPLLKELFLLIYLNSAGKDGIGISTSKLKEILWFDKTEKDASNNRAVNIARLKVLLKKVGNNITISKTTGYWKVEVENSEIVSDYDEFIKISKTNNQKKKDIVKLIQITKKGGFLQNVEYDWLDSFKADISNQTIDLFNSFNELNLESNDPELSIKIADTMFLFDPVNEDALAIKCLSLSKMGKHSLAKNTYNKFFKEYKVLYNEEYPLSFNDIIDS